MRDIDLGRRLGFDRPRDVRKLVARHRGALENFGTVAEELASYRGRPSLTTLLNEKQAVYLTSKSDTPAATDLLVQIVEVFVAWRHGHAPAVAPAEILPEAHATPNTFAQALRLAADQQETLEQQQSQIAKLEPKALALVRLGATPGAITITAAAKLLKIKRSELIHMLVERRVIYRRHGPRGEWLGYSDREEAGWVEHTHTTVQGRDGRDKAVAQVRLTPKLITKIAERLVIQAEAA